MPDFSKLLRAPSGTETRPDPLAVGDYSGVIKGWAPVEAPADKDYKTIIRFQLGVTGWPEDVPAEDRLDKKGQPIDLSRIRLRRDFYDHRLFDLDEFLRTLGIVPDGTSYEELLPQTIGQPVTIEVAQYINQRTNEPGNQVNNIYGDQPGH